MGRTPCTRKAPNRCRLVRFPSSASHCWNRAFRVVSGRDAAAVAQLTAAAERLTLLSRLSGGPRTHQRYHPLVREFLEGRFRSIDGEAAVAELHRRTALAVADTDWRVAAHHYRAAGDTSDMLATISRAIPTGLPALSSIRSMTWV